MRNEDVVKHSIEVLKELRAESHSKVNDSVILRFDEVISELELLSEESDTSSSRHEALELLAICLDAAGIGFTLYQIIAESCR